MGRSVYLGCVFFVETSSLIMQAGELELSGVLAALSHKWHRAGELTFLGSGSTRRKNENKDGSSLNG